MARHSFSDWSPEKRKEIAKQGQKASTKARNEKKDLQQVMKLWLDSEVGKDKNGKKLTGRDVMLQVAVKEMSQGNPKFWELIRDTAGEKPADKIVVAEVEQTTIDEVESIVNGYDKTSSN